MGRSVTVPRDAAVTYYFPFEEGYDAAGEYDPDLSRVYWDDMVENIRGELTAVSDLFDSADKWVGDEMRCIASNGIVDVVLCEYMNFCSLSLVPTAEPLEDVWEPVKQVWDDFAAEWATSHDDEITERLSGIGLTLCHRLGTFSNGESVYQPVGR